MNEIEHFIQDSFYSYIIITLRLVINMNVTNKVFV